MMERIAYYKDGTVYFMGDGLEQDVVDKIETDIRKTLCLNGVFDMKGNLMADTSTGLVKGRRDAYKKYHALEYFLIFVECK